MEKYKSQIKWILFIAIIICSFSEGLKQLLFGVPIVHVGNLLLVALFFWCMFIEKRRIAKALKPFVLWIVSFIAVGTIGAINFMPGIVLYLWALRTYLKMFLLLFDCIMILGREDLGFLLKFFNGAIFVHVILTLFQFLVLGIRWDYLNGIFGTGVADSSCLHALLLINSCICIFELSRDKMPIKMFIVHLIWMSLNALISEIRAWFYEIVILMVVYLIFSHDYKKVLKMLPALIVILIAGASLMPLIYPYTANFFGFSGFVNILGEHHFAGSVKALGRRNQISGLTGPILETAKELGKEYGVLPLITGLGLGNAEYSTRGIASSFYRTYGDLGYPTFLLSFLYVETGIIGVIVYNLMWVFQLFSGMLKYKKQNKDYLLLILASLSFLITACYNQTLRSNYGYIMWAFLGAVIVFCENNKMEFE